MRLIRFGALTLWFMAAGAAQGDTLFLRNGMTLKIDALSCEATVCRVTLPGGEAQLSATEVLRVDPDDEVDRAPVFLGEESENSGALRTGSRTIDQIVVAAARKYALPPSLVRAVARAESALNPDAVSPKGAQGVMQLMPGTARELGVRDAFDPEENIEAGARLLRQLLEKYQGRVAEALAAYNAGEGAVAKYMGVPPYRETRGYIRRVVKDFEGARSGRRVGSSQKEP